MQRFVKIVTALLKAGTMYVEVSPAISLRVSRKEMSDRNNSKPAQDARKDVNEWSHCMPTKTKWINADHPRLLRGQK